MNNQLEKVLQVKNAALIAARHALNQGGFLEIQTPKISFLPTDVDEHLFKTQYFGVPAFLIQTPQFYKQAYVINGCPRVFEIGPVFRSEPRVTSRHLSEFTSLDIESSQFRTVDQLVSFEQQLITTINHAIATLNGVHPIQSYETVSVPKIQKRLGLNYPLSPKDEEEICTFVGTDAVFLIEFPERERVFYYAANQGKSLSFDLLMRGLEITSGGIRRTDQQELTDAMRIAGIDTERYSAYLELFDSNTPLHGGFAIGVERFVKQSMGLADINLINPYSKKPNTTSEQLRW